MKTSPIDISAARPELLQCVVCRRAFEFDRGEAALVLRHVAYGYDLVHEGGGCLVAAQQWIFPEPGYDCAAFGPDSHRRRVLAAFVADGWLAVLPESTERLLSGSPIRFEALNCWVQVEREDGSLHVEGIVRDLEWWDEPGAAEFPEAATGRRALISYAGPDELTNQTRRSDWRAAVYARYQAGHRPDEGRSPVEVAA